jgi:ketosteroid isomerase-like protein
MIDDGTRSDKGAHDLLAIVRRYLDGWESGDPAIFEEVLAPDFFDVMYGRRRERAELLQQAAGTEFEDRVITIEEAVISGDVVVVRTTGRHTHVATGRRVTVSGMIWVRIRDGRITTGWGEHDRLGQLQQLGVVPTGAEAQQWLAERLRALTPRSGEGTGAPADTDSRPPDGAG